MAIVNVTPDSFSEQAHLLPEGGMAGADLHALREQVLALAVKHLREGANLLDIGGCSTRPGFDPVSPEEESARICFALRAIRAQYPEAVLSVDTFRASVAQAALACGANIINDVSGGAADPGMFPLVAAARAPYILTYTRVWPPSQPKAPVADPMADMLLFFQQQTSRLRSLGADSLILDPGFGFSKTLEENYRILQHLDRLQPLGMPVLVGLSRKSMVYQPLGITPQEALNGTTALHMAALLGGAAVLRVHDVREAREAVRLFALLRSDTQS